MSNDPQPALNPNPINEIQETTAAPFEGQSAGEGPIPRWLLGIAIALLIWGGYYVNRYGGRFQADALEGTYQRIAAGPPVPVDPLVLGAELFVSQGCVACHQSTGQGLPGLYPPLAGSEWVHGPPERLSRIVLQGFEGPVEIQGQLFNNVMPGFGTVLDDQQIAAVLTYIRQEWGNQADPVPPSIVTEARVATSSRTTAWTAEELEAIGSEK